MRRASISAPKKVRARPPPQHLITIRIAKGGARPYLHQVLAGSRRQSIAQGLDKFESDSSASSDSDSGAQRNSRLQRPLPCALCPGI
jgi:hypothetical protein